MNNLTEDKGTRRRAILVALLVALVGLTIAPGFKCTEKQPDGTERTVEF